MDNESLQDVVIPWSDYDQWPTNIHVWILLRGDAISWINSQIDLIMREWNWEAHFVNVPQKARHGIPSFLSSHPHRLIRGGGGGGWKIGACLPVWLTESCTTMYSPHALKWSRLKLADCRLYTLQTTWKLNKTYSNKSSFLFHYWKIPQLILRQSPYSSNKTVTTWAIK